MKGKSNIIAACYKQSEICSLNLLAVPNEPLENWHNAEGLRLSPPTLQAHCPGHRHNAESLTHYSIGPLNHFLMALWFTVDVHHKV